jgi:hypothetical protein
MHDPVIPPYKRFDFVLIVAGTLLYCGVFGAVVSILRASAANGRSPWVMRPDLANAFWLAT